MSNEQIKHMVDRFLQWKLPENFNPDGGISFKKTFNENAPWGPMTHEPVGTNLFDAVQAEAMVRYMVNGLPAELGEPAAEPQPEVTDGLGSVWPPCDKHKRSLEVVRPGDARCPDCEYEKHVQRASGRSLADKDLQLNRHPVRAPAPAAPLGDDDYLSDLDRVLDERDEANHEVARLSAELADAKAHVEYLCADQRELSAELEQVKAERSQLNKNADILERRMVEAETLIRGLMLRAKGWPEYAEAEQWLEAALGEKGES